jgi:hypothetical protein
MSAEIAPHERRRRHSPTQPAKTALFAGGRARCPLKLPQAILASKGDGPHQPELRHPTSPLPLLPSGPDGIHDWSSRRSRCGPPEPQSGGQRKQGLTSVQSPKWGLSWHLTNPPTPFFSGAAILPQEATHPAPGNRTSAERGGYGLSHADQRDGTFRAGFNA